MRSVDGRNLVPVAFTLERLLDASDDTLALE
jgi:hypothetical protein